MGGAQAIAALAHGTESIRRVDVIVGPGNLYVQEAKRQVSGRRRHRRLRRPERPVRDRSPTAPTRDCAAADLRAQAEHGPDSLVVAVSDDPALLPDDGVGDPRARLMDAALAFAEALAPEHLQLMGAAAEALAPRVRSAGCLFVGAHAGTAFGDYVAGSNHTLPDRGRGALRLRPQRPPLPPPHGRGPRPGRAAARARRPPAPRSRAPRASRPTPRRWRRDGRIQRQ